MLNLTELGVEVFIKKSRAASFNSFWDNYNLIIWKKDPSGYFEKNGMYLNNMWGKSEKFSVATDGTWKIPNKYVRYFK